MPRRNPNRSTKSTDQLREHVEQALEALGLSVAGLARRMTAAGCPTDTNALWRALRGTRDIYANEAFAMAAVLGVSVEALVSSEPLGDLTVTLSAGL